MSTFSSTPHLLTKERLKSALRANNIPLPRAEQKKAFYVELYLEHLTSQNDNEEFSSNDEETSEYSPMRATEKLPSKPPPKIVINKRVKGGLPFDVTALSDGDLARQLKSFGAPAGPITDSTRPLYQKKLAKLLTEELKQPAIPPPTKILPKQAKASPPEPKIKKEYEDFSDGSDDAATDDMDLESVEHLDSYNMDEDRKDQQFARPQDLSPPRMSSTPSTSTPRKRVVTSTVTTRQQTRQTYSNNAGNTVKETESVETVAVKKKSPPAKEEKSICGPHIQIFLAVIVFLVFIVFLIYHLMDENPKEQLEEAKRQ